MPATSAYQAGIETNATLLSYGIETVWGTAPATTFQALRYTSESLSGTKSRSRPQEINQTREMSAATTTQEAAAGAINYALSYGTYDDLLSVLLGNDWQAPQTIAGIAGDITLTLVSGVTGTLSSTLGTKFSNIALGQYLRLLSFTNAANNGIYKVTAKADNSHLSVTLLGTGPLVTETPAGTAAQVRASTITNGVQFKSLFIQQMMSSTKYFQYPGSYVTGFTLQGGVGNFLTGSFNIASQFEQTAITDASTGGVLAAPTGRVHDPVGTFGGVFWNEAALQATVDSFTITINNTGAAAEYGMGSPKAAGMLAGEIEATGKLKMFFKDFTYYALFKAETSGTLAFITKDLAGNAYVLQFKNAALMNPSIPAQAPNGAVYAEFTIEGNPATAGGTFTIDRLAAT